MPSCSSGRPLGVKASKAQKLNQGCAAANAGIEMAKAGNLLAFAAKERLAYSKQKAQALSRIANHNIMSMNINGLNEIAREFYVMEQKRILNEARELAKNELEPEPVDDDDDDDWVDVSGAVKGTDGRNDPDMGAEYLHDNDSDDNF